MRGALLPSAASTIEASLDRFLANIREFRAAADRHIEAAGNQEGEPATDDEFGLRLERRREENEGAVREFFSTTFEPQVEFIFSRLRQLCEHGITDRAQIDAALGHAAARLDALAEQMARQIDAALGPMAVRCYARSQRKPEIDAQLGPTHAYLYARAQQIREQRLKTLRDLNDRANSQLLLEMRALVSRVKREDRSRSRSLLSRRCTPPRRTARRTRRNVHRRASAATGGSADDGEGGGLDPPPLPVPRPASLLKLEIACIALVVCFAAIVADLFVVPTGTAQVLGLALAAAGIPASERFYSCSDLARRWSCSRDYVWRLVRLGQLRAVRFPRLSTKPSHSTRGDLLRVPIEEVERFEIENLEPYDAVAPPQSGGRRGRCT